eukprot:TRINITY_DN77719_c0_g1_i1.p1 TRINITY_DN77719_c0_g1~~TRINITY_DN77719_c0_g1_i1.p1  ORF type:complete len:169 (-),score=21.24 TRINITY_DN77719_c0_g1_i1:3-509(-)
MASAIPSRSGTRAARWAMRRQRTPSQMFTSADTAASPLNMSSAPSGDSGNLAMTHFPSPETPLSDRANRLPSCCCRDRTSSSLSSVALAKSFRRSFCLAVGVLAGVRGSRSAASSTAATGAKSSARSTCFTGVLEGTGACTVASSLSTDCLKDSFGTYSSSKSLRSIS